MTKQEREKYKFLDMDYDLKFPQLILAVADECEFTSDRIFISIQHQTAGHACHQHYMSGTILTPKPSVQTAINTICDSWLDSDVGCFGVTFNNLTKYRQQLVDLLEVDCQWSYPQFEEAIYPVDCCKEYLDKLCEDKLPDELDDLIVWKSDWDKVCGSINRWNLYLMGENCD